MIRPNRPSRRLLTSLLFALLAPAFAQGCGNDGSPPTSTSDPDGGPGADASLPLDASPTVVATTPAALATGVEADAYLSIRFSEPMDAASVKAAYTSTELPAASVQFLWNDAGDTLKIVPDEPLALAFGDASVAPKTYSLTIGAGATSATGESLDDAFVLTFSTLRRVTSSEPAIASLTGRATSVGSASTVLTAVGDFANNASALSVATFSLANLPVDVRLDSAFFVVDEASVSGTPDANLGELRAEHLFFSAFDASVYSTPVLDSVPNVALVERSKGPPYSRAVDVTQFVLDDLANREARSDRTQLRLRYTTATDSDGVSDLLALSLDSIEIRYVVLVP